MKRSNVNSLNPLTRSRRGFTLVELMLSIALVVILMAGINYIFKTAADAVGSGQQFNEFNRTEQAAQPELFEDFHSISPDSPCFIIASRDVIQFLNQADFQTSVTSNNGTNTINDPSRVVIDSAGTQIGITRGLYNYRDHRTDMVKFFVHSLLRRKTADTAYTSSTTASDAFVQIGHVALPNTTNDPASFSGPRTGANGYAQRVAPWAADWVLGKSAVLLKDESSILPPTGVTADHYYKKQPNAAGGGYGIFGANMTPLGYSSPDDAGASQIQTSRLDLAGVTPDQFRGIIGDAINLYIATPFTPPGNKVLWWNPLVYTTPFTQTTATPLMYTTGVPQATAMLSPVYNPPVSTGATPTIPPLYRLDASPLIDTPLTPASVAQLAPYFIQHCSQFIVEYAGDYLQQDTTPPASSGLGKPSLSTNAGAITGIGPDGQIDYIWVADSSDPTAITYSKQIRWYGMPRSSTGQLNTNPMMPKGPQTTIRGFNPGTTPGPSDDPTIGSTMQDFKDVIPLRDYYSMYFAKMTAALKNYVPGTLISPPWEVDINFDPTADYAGTIFPVKPYPQGLNAGFGLPAAANGNPVSPRYVAAWYNDMPSLIRILIKVDDTNNKVKDGPWYEFVFRLK